MVAAKDHVPVSLQTLNTVVLAHAIEAIPSPLVIIDTEQKNTPIVYANQALYDLTGYDQAEVVGHNFIFLQGPDTDHATIRQIRRAVKNYQSIRVTVKSYRKDGSMFWNDLALSPLTAANGKIRYYVGIRQDVTTIIDYANEQVRLQKVEHQAQLLRRQKKQLLELNHAKDEFISLSSHQLRTPATSVKQYLGMILEGFTGPVPKRLQVFIQTAYDSNDRQLTIINDLLRAAKLDSGSFQLNRVPTDPARLLDQVITEYKPILTMRQQTVDTRYETHSQVVVDQLEMHIALLNLLENASKYSPNGTVIAIDVRKTATSVSISVSDQGVGIEPTNHRLIFEKFTRVDNVLSDTVSGNGLGLYFVKRIVRLHNGKLKLISSLGQGSTFVISLPAP